ncbi:glycosyltransferase family 2 protein [Mesobacillus harenae]|uniref:glycosyltransferase family 2 protein n=1 Tax=Mesobacillus harenae TaxID=2213203 RepID=UPI00158097AB|nr:glycosyltransferase [Mesobacillus harenae]
MEPLVSVIMPVYNVENYIAKSIESVLRQSYQNLELLVVIDGSPDNSGEKAERFAVHDHRVRVLYKENGGLSDARNRGIENANGHYLYFLDSDDYIEAHLLEETVRFAEDNDLDVVVFGYTADYENHNQVIIHSHQVIPPGGIYSNENMNQIKLNDDFYNYIGYAWNKLYKAGSIKEGGFRFVKGLSLIEDIEFNYSVLRSIKKLGFIEKSFYHYIQRPRMTLGNAKYKDFYELKLRAATLRVDLLRDWGFEEKTVLNQSLLLYFRVLKSALKNVSEDKDLPFTNKRMQIKTLLEFDEQLGCQRNAKLSLPIQDQLLFNLVKKKSLLGIHALCKFTSIVRGL